MNWLIYRFLSKSLIFNYFNINNTYLCTQNRHCVQDSTDIAFYKNIICSTIKLFYINKKINTKLVGKYNLKCRFSYKIQRVKRRRMVGKDNTHKTIKTIKTR